MKKSLIYLFSFACILNACEKKKSTQAEIEIPSVPEIITEEIQKSYQNCSIDSLTCTYVSITFPLFTDSLKEGLNEIIREKVQLVADDFTSESSSKLNIVEVAEAFIRDYKNFADEFSETSVGWYLKIESDINSDSENYLAFNIYFESFTGGAHPNSSTSYFVIDLLSKSELKVEDIVKDTIQFKRILEQAFREQTGIKDDESLADAGYWIEDGDFYLNDNIGITDDKIIIHYNPYEIAPYSMGPTTIELEKNQISDVLKIK